jgi:hypothetical protein
VLHRAVREHLATFLDEARANSAHGFGLPGFVEREFREYLACGVLAHGFARVRCTSCGDEHLVSFSCKRRGVCPSCTTRRAVDAAAHLVDAVLPAVPMRQWVLSLPIKVRWLLARRPALVGRVLAVFLRALSTWQRLRGAIALSRLSELPDGRVAYHMKRPLPALHGRPGERAKLAAIGGCDGRTHLVLTGVELLRKLAPLIPPPRFHLLRVHGVFAPNSKLRSLVVPKPPMPAPQEGAPSDKQRERPWPSPYRLDWAAALKRVHGVDVLKCARCCGRLVVLAFIEKLAAVRAILDHLALPSSPQPLGKARGPPQAAWDF